MADLVFDLSLARGGQIYAYAGRIPLQGVTAIMGPSGAGKSTFLQMLAGLNRQTRGEARLDDTPWASRRKRLRPDARRIGYVFQDARLFPHLTVLENISYGARRRDVAPSALHGIAEGLGLTDILHRLPETLSHGETRRVALARALASAPDILFLDEPLSGLDDAARAEVLPLLGQAVAGAGIPALYVTHSQDEVCRFADRVLLIEGGRIAGWGRPPPTLEVTLAEGQGGHVTMDLGPVRFSLPGQGRPGDARRIALPENGLLISRDPPGPSGAIAVVPAEAVAITPKPSGPDIVLAVAGQRLDWQLHPGSSLAERLPAEGERLWLSILAAHLR